jgi:uncharacterized protein (TIGR03067 family)
MFLFLASFTANAEDEAAKKLASQLQGLWKVTAMEGNGNQAPEKTLKGMRFLIKGDKISLSGQAKDLRGYRLDASAKPKAIDIFDDERNEFSKGVYQIEGDTMKLCFSQQTKLDRPESFDTTGTKYLCFTLKRAAEQDAADPESKPEVSGKLKSE